MSSCIRVARPSATRTLLAAIALGSCCNVAVQAQTPAATARSAHASIEAVFSPQENIVRAIETATQHARSEILVQAYYFSNKKIARALMRAQRRGVRVQVLLDQRQLEGGATLVARDLAAAGVEVFIDGDHAAAHNKVMLIDAGGNESTLITGSFNFTYAAQDKNAENILIVRGSRALAQRYHANWQAHRQHSQRLQ